jgi:hypothetical protein
MDLDQCCGSHLRIPLFTVWRIWILLFTSMADPDQYLAQNECNVNLRQLVYSTDPSRLHFEPPAYFVSVNGPLHGSILSL